MCECCCWVLMTLNICCYHTCWVRYPFYYLHLVCLFPVWGSCSSGLSQTIIQASSSEYISLVKRILVWEVYKWLNFEAPWETPEHLGPLSFWCGFDCIIPICLTSEAIRILDMTTALFSGAQSRKWGLAAWWLLFTWWEDLMPTPVYSPVHGEGIWLGTGYI